MDFIKKMEKNATQFADNYAIGTGGDQRYSYSEVWELSGRVFRYLREKGIGREDFVMINLKRGAEFLIAALGIWRAAAAYVIVEQGEKKDRRDYIYSDCNCKLCINEKIYDEILARESLDGYEAADDHDAAYVCYTSGTTGYPKGAVHEFGVLRQNIASYYYEGKYELVESDRYAVSAPLNFAAINIIFPGVLYAGGELVIVPLEIVKNPNRLKQFFEDEKITAAFFTPSFIRLFHEFNPEFRILYLAGETTKNIYFDKIETYNVHGQSETGFITTTFLIDKAYDNTPIGKTFISDLKLKIITEQGMEAADGETGELCFKNPFFRGYLNQQDLTDEVFRDGIYHTGDNVKRLPDGNLVLVGRTDDMIKINGNRVEPAEIENVLREIMKVEWVATKCIINGESVGIAAYYVDEPCMPLADIKAIAAKRLPSYMVPAYYIQVDYIPMNANGKFSRKSLPNPDIHAVAAYAAPKDQMEKALTSAFCSVLGLGSVGIDDDFYELGGDSLSCIEIICEMDMDELSADIIFRERTIRKIAAYLRKSSDFIYGVDKTDLAWEIAQEGCMLSPFQMYFLQRHQSLGKNGSFCMYQLPVLMKYSLEVDAKRLAESIYISLEAHPLLQTRIIVDENGAYRQFLDKTLLKPILVEEIEEAEFESIRNNLIQPMELMNQSLYRIRIFRSEKHVYMYVNLHHIIADGSSLHVLMKDIYNAYYGEAIQKDLIYLYLKRMEEHKLLPYYEECKNYYEQRYSHVAFSTIPKKDHDSTLRSLGTKTTKLIIDNDAYARLMERYHINDNALFILVTLLAMAKYNKTKDVFGTWTYHGRDEMQKRNMVGPLIKDLPIALQLTQDTTVKQLIDSVNEQIKNGIAHSPYPYTFMGDITYANDYICFLYQMDVFDFESDDLFKGRQLPIIESGNELAENTYTVQILRKDNHFEIKIEYVEEFYEYSSIEKYISCYQSIVTYLLTDEEHLMEYVHK